MQRTNGSQGISVTATNPRINMAKLSAHNRTELARYEKSYESKEPLDAGAVETRTIAVMSDNAVLEKWKMSGGRWKDRPLTKNWKVIGRWASKYITREEYEQSLVNRGWKKVTK